MQKIPREVIRLLKDDATIKDFSVHFPNGELADLDGGNIVEESVTFTESLCSGESIKFGACESSVIEFDALDIPSIKGATIECACEVDTSSLGETWNKSHNTLYDYTIGSYQFKAQVSRTISFTEFDKYNRLWFQFYQSDSGAVVNYLDYTITTNGVTTTNSVELTGVYEMNIPDGTTLVTVTMEVAIGGTLKVTTDKYYRGTWYQIKYGSFIVNSCTRDDSDFQRRSIVAYSKSALDSVGANVLTSAKFNTATTSAKNLSFDVELETYINLMNSDIYDYLLSETATVPTIVSEVKKYGTSGTSSYLEVTVNYAEFQITQTQGQTPFAIDLTNWTESAFDGYRVAVRNLASDSGYAAINNLSKIECLLPSVNSTTYVSAFMDFADRIRLYLNAYTGLTSKYKVRVPLGFSATNGNAAAWKDYTATGINLYYYSWSASNPRTTFTVSFPRVKNGTYYLASMENFQIADVVTGMLECNGEFGKVLRDGDLREFSVAMWGGLTPSDTRTPTATLVPSAGGSDLIDKFLLKASEYYSTRFDDESIKPFGKITYTINNATTDVYLHGLTADTFTDDYAVYDVSDNYIVNHAVVSGDRGVVSDLKDALEYINYMPASIEGIGLPHVEAGDWVTVQLPDSTMFDTIILRRTLTGIRALNDAFESK